MEGKQPFDFILVLDFEATCEKNIKLQPQEIIEFPILKINTKNFAIDDVFHQYVEPTTNKQLSKFCTELTGITQDMINGKPNITECLNVVDEWIKSKNDLKLDAENNPINFIFLTCGDWDLKTMLPSQCKYFNINYSNYFKNWINIKKSFAQMTGHFPKGMPDMLKMLNLTLDGRHHSGIDDCKNIAKIAREMASRGFIFEKT